MARARFLSFLFPCAQVSRRVTNHRDPPDPLMTGGCLPRLDAEAPEEVRLGLPRQVSRREAVWEQRLETETAVGRGRSTVVASLTILVDVVIYFEVLTLLQVWCGVTRAGFPRRLLRMEMGYFSLRRLLVHDGSSSDMTERTAALIVDSRFSCVLSARCLADKITNSYGDQVRAQPDLEFPRYSGAAEHDGASSRRIVPGRPGGVGGGPFAGLARWRRQDSGDRQPQLSLQEIPRSLQSLLFTTKAVSSTLM